MARIAFAWELGNSIGHAMAGVRLGEALVARGHEVALFLRELEGLHVLPEAAALAVFQAPRVIEEGDPALPSTYADILRGCGYRDDRVLSGLLGGWRALFGAWKPDLLVADFAPTALLAARTLGVKRVTYGNGFFTPPRLAPLPPFRVDVALDPQALAASEQRVLASVNAAVTRVGAKPLAQLAEQFEASEDFLCTFADLDHYATRPRSNYWGPRMVTDAGATLHWPRANAKRVLVYVQADYPGLDELLAALLTRPHSVLASLPGLDAARRAQLELGNRRLIPGLARLDALLPECDLLVCHGGDVASGALMHGVPTLVLPRHYEQHLTAIRLSQAGVALRPSAPPVRGELPALLDRLLGEPAFKKMAQAYSRRFPGFTPREQRRRVVARIEEILAG